MLKAFLTTNPSFEDTPVVDFYKTICSSFVLKIENIMDMTESDKFMHINNSLNREQSNPINDEADNSINDDRNNSINDEADNSINDDQEMTAVDMNFEEVPQILGSSANTVALSRLSTYNSDLDHIKLIELSDNRSRRSRKSYRVFDPKDLPNKYKVQLTKTRKAFQKHCIFYLTKMEDAERTAANMKTPLGKLGCKVIVQCGMCKKICVDFSNMTKHLNTHKEEEKCEYEKNRQYMIDVVSALVNNRSISVPKFWISSPNNGFFNQILYHFDKNFVEFSAVENNSYRQMFARFNKVYHDRGAFSKAICALDAKFKMEIQNVLKGTDLISLIIDGWTDVSNRKYLGVIASFVPNLNSLQEIPRDKIDRLIRNNNGELQCKLFLGLLPLEDQPEDAKNLAKWILDISDDYGISEKIFTIISDKASANVKMVGILEQNLKNISPLIGRTNEVFHINCLAHLENRIMIKISKAIQDNSTIRWPVRITELCVFLHCNTKLRFAWKDFFGFILPKKNSTRWFSEFRLYYSFMRASSKLNEFVNENWDDISKSGKAALFQYTNEEINQILFFLYLLAPFNYMFMQFQKHSANSAIFGSYYYHLISTILTDIESIATSGKLIGNFGSALKLNRRFTDVTYLSETQREISKCFIPAKEHFTRHYKDQKDFTVHYITDVLCPFSKFSFLQATTSLDMKKRAFERAIEFFGNYLEDPEPPFRFNISHLQNIPNVYNSGGLDVFSIQSLLRLKGNLNEFETYMLEPKLNDIPDTLEEAAERTYTYWTDRRLSSPKLSKLALSLLYSKCSSADIERTFSICKNIIRDRENMRPDTFQASIRIRLSLNDFGIRNQRDISEDIRPILYDCIIGDLNDVKVAED